MTLVFIAVLLGAMALDWLVMRRLEGRFPRRGTAHREPAVEIVVPRSLFFHPGHSWARLDRDGSITVGIDDLLRTLVGRVSAVELPAVGDRVVAGRPAVVIGGDGRTLRVPAPVSGRVTEVNRHLGSDPSRLRWRPYKEGWAFRLAPGPRLSAELGALAIGDDAERWMAREIRRVDALLRDGRLEPPVEGAVGRADGVSWAAFERDLLAGAAPGEVGS